MNLEKRIIAFVKLGNILREFALDSTNSPIKEAIKKAQQHNGWFTEENVINMIGEIGKSFEEGKIRKWLSNYKIENDKPSEKKVGVIMAGNIPLVGFHDFLCVLMSGNIFVGKLSSDDEFLLSAVANLLCKIEPEFKKQIHFIKQIIFLIYTMCYFQTIIVMTFCFANTSISQQHKKY